MIPILGPSSLKSRSKSPPSSKNSKNAPAGRGSRRFASADFLTAPTKPKNRVLSVATRIYILEQKLTDEQINELKDLVTMLGGLVSTREHANVIVTDVRAPARLRKHLSSEDTNSKTIVSTDWLRDTVGQEVMIDFEKYKIIRDGKDGQAGTVETEAVGSASSSVTHTIPAQPSRASGSSGQSQSQSTPRGRPPTRSPDGSSSTDTDDDNAGPSSVAQTRRTPSRLQSHSSVASPNVTPSKRDRQSPRAGDEEEDRKDEGPARKRVSGIHAPDRESSAEHTADGAHDSSRETSPFRPLQKEDADEDDSDPYGLNCEDAPAWRNARWACQRPSPLVCINQDLANELDVIRKQRWLIGDVQSALSYQRAISAVKSFPAKLETRAEAKKLQGIGPKIAGLVEQFNANGHIAEAAVIRADPAQHVMAEFMELYSVGPTKARELYNEGARSLEDVIHRSAQTTIGLGVSESLRILPDLRTKIPRLEVEEIARLIQTTMDEVQPGCKHIICGGYRRGKSQSNDIDIVMTHPDDQHTLEAMHRLVEQLKKKGLVTHVIKMSHPAERAGTAGHLDSANIVFLPPPSPLAPHPRHRRVDIIFAAHRAFGCAVVGWTGSTMFERDLRRYAHTVGYKFDSSGVQHQETGEIVPTPTEESVFELLDLEWMPPHLRNCDA